jgi:hypothetical protein
MASERNQVEDRLIDIRHRLSDLVNNEGLIKESELDKSLWNVSRGLVLKKEVQIQIASQDSEASKSSPTLRRKKEIERRFNIRGKRTS